MGRRLIPIIESLLIFSGIGLLIYLFWDSILTILRSLLTILGSVLVLIALILGIIAILRRRAVHRYRTPYDAIRERIQKSPNPSRSMEKPYDFFVSYKSEDAMKVRPLVEQMLASGVNVWFAEYNITLEGWNAFKHEIDVGIANSSHGLCFTNKDYIKSLNCIYELNQLLSPQNCGPTRVIEIMFPPQPLPHQLYPQLKTLTSIQYHDDPNELIDQINQVTGRSILSTLPKRPGSPASRSFDYGKNQYRLDLAGWTLRSAGSSMERNGEVEGPVLERMCGKYQVRGYLNIGTQISFPRAAQDSDDRQNYEYGIQFARVHYAQLPMQCIGLHLFFLHGLSHIALTARGSLGWCRTYSVITPMQGTGQQVEFLFDFYMRSPFEEFCRHAHQMERIVQSLAWDT